MGIGLELLGGGLGLAGGLLQQGFSARQAQRQMDFQREMSSTVYQRGVEDMRKAGINPILAAGNVSTPGASGAMAEGVNVGGSALSGMASAAEIARTNADTALRHSQAFAAMQSAGRDVSSDPSGRVVWSLGKDGQPQATWVNMPGKPSIGEVDYAWKAAQTASAKAAAAANNANVPFLQWQSKHPLLTKIAAPLVGASAGALKAAAMAP